MAEQTLSLLLPFVLPVAFVLVAVTAVLLGFHLSRARAAKRHETDRSFAGEFIPRKDLITCAENLVPRLDAREPMLAAAKGASQRPRDDVAVLERLERVAEDILTQITHAVGLEPATGNPFEITRFLEDLRENDQPVIPEHIIQLLHSIRLSLEPEWRSQVRADPAEAYFQLTRLFFRLLHLLRWYHKDWPKGSEWYSIYATSVPRMCDERIRDVLPQRDWLDYPMPERFVGRTAQLGVLENWIRYEKCRVVLLVGMAGAGKSTLATEALADVREEPEPKEGGVGKSEMAIKVAKGVGADFRFSFWRSLKNPQPPEELFGQLVSLLSGEGLVDGTADDWVDQTITLFRQVRALVILDNFESLLEEKSLDYQRGFEAYGKLIQAAAERDHKSCLVLTSRVTPKEVTDGIANDKPVRKMVIGGLGEEESRALIANTAPGISWDQTLGPKLIRYYEGNPYMIRMAAGTIRDRFGGSIAAFWAEYPHRKRFNLPEHLGWHFDQLNDPEREILYWMAIEREPVTWGSLQQDMLDSPDQTEDREDDFDRLCNKLFIHRSDVNETEDKLFTLQPVMLEYVTDRLVSGMYEELKKELSL